MADDESAAMALIRLHRLPTLAQLQKQAEVPKSVVKARLQSAESSLDALNTVDLGPKRLFSVGECALWARLTGPQFAAQVAAAFA
jgi:hypothetical protein